MRFKNIPLDYVTLGLSLLALIFDIVGLFAGPWWTHTGRVGQSLFGITSHRVCQFSCVDKTVLVIEGGKEFILTVRGFEVLGLIFMLIGTILTVLAVILRTRPIHTAIVYIHGAAGNTRNIPGMSGVLCSVHVGSERFM
ncbi:hypothetical protein DPMN_009250 [Dreissena polymorpha]|uniref:Uncharacterized protein n=1 Tax=Dreissena polymorpha TaxID=45954 RepID=A0A9D4S0F2_DREPO|nr:hypothetical protein DPMN_009250 [Dreissena polymorpha]